MHLRAIRLPPLSGLFRSLLVFPYCGPEVAGGGFGPRAALTQPASMSAVGHTGPEVAGGGFGPRAALTQPTSVSATT